MVEVEEHPQRQQDGLAEAVMSCGPEEGRPESSGAMYQNKDVISILMSLNRRAFAGIHRRKHTSMRILARRAEPPSTATPNGSRPDRPGISCSTSFGSDASKPVTRAAAASCAATEAGVGSLFPGSNCSGGQSKTAVSNCLARYHPENMDNIFGVAGRALVKVSNVLFDVFLASRHPTDLLRSSKLP